MPTARRIYVYMCVCVCPTTSSAGYFVLRKISLGRVRKTIPVAFTRDVGGGRVRMCRNVNLPPLR